MAAGLNVRTEGERSELDGGIYLLLKSLAIYSAVPPPPSPGTYRDPSVSATAKLSADGCVWMAGKPSSCQWMNSVRERERDERSIKNRNKV